MAAALGILGLVLSGAYSFMPLNLGMGELAWTSTATFLFLTVPLFILLGEILLRAGIADRMYSAVTQWVSWLPGGLMHSNVGACALFATTSGSSAATAATIGIFVVVVGSIYAGLATPTESAALGVVAALVLAGIRGQLTIAMLKSAFEGTMRTTAMVMLIIMAAFFLNLVLATIGLTAALIGFVQRSGLTPLETILLVIVFYLVLGCFMETLAMTITTVPVVTEIVVAVGYDPVWFGVLVMLLTETALITPPVGVNLFVVQEVRARGSLNDIMIGATPFVLAMFAMFAIMIAFPEVALWLPRLVF